MEGEGGVSVEEGQKLKRRREEAGRAGFSSDWGGRVGGAYGACGRGGGCLTGVNYPDAAKKGSPKARQGGRAHLSFSFLASPHLTCPACRRGGASCVDSAVVFFLLFGTVC